MRKIQVIKCKCGKSFAGCVEPECYIDKDWQKELRKYVGKGCTVEIINAGTFSMESCTCGSEETEIADPNQLALFPDQRTEHAHR